MNASVVERFSLKKGQELCGDALSEVMAADNVRKAKRRALYLLGEREYASRELYKKLRQSYGEEAAQKAVDYVTELGYLNDEEYAPKLADYLIRTKRFGKRKARYEMLRRGLSPQLVDNTLEDIGDDEIDEEITALLERKYSEKIKVDFS